MYSELKKAVNQQREILLLNPGCEDVKCGETQKEDVDPGVRCNGSWPSPHHAHEMLVWATSTQVGNAGRPHC